ncbi:TIGR03088 family PEP-CTERM/XrtA system glycosyltransferase [Pseudothauera rhizosphaerae]|uniref:TIGR03088 family PEP-CTERM/XrtA system glycosyltransferase n=1 Tax=Pseudothauera rhizosphaerae TaxID=2565932 RepID=A0A4S4APR6_9RHOO|nr:TIGR03088 family PEP-CTERM/XrtA system glycosyltransferase [Pseudothauera rhizosphaerae]THF61631.1 TIGR03088 family PEP-CTERM/XrtA system glycosyltransferase [Pseudothauera rhizosphaerae]
MNGLPPLVMHVVFRFGVGGLENGVVNLINRMPPDRFRHAVVALTECEPAFSARITRPDVGFVSLHKPAGHGVRLYPQLYRLFREQRPAVVHTRNLAALEAAVPARAAGVPVRIHGEHGWDVSDPQGLRRKFQFIRRLYSPFVGRYVALSGQIEAYLADRVGIGAHRIERICNGVDTLRFRPAAAGETALPDCPFREPGLIRVGTVGRLQAVKDQLNLVRAFALACREGGTADALRLVIVGDGPLRGAVEDEIRAAGLADRVWLAGERSDVPEAMRALDVFVLPSRAEGISNTILEAMASGLPVVATDVGGNGELVVADETGRLVPPAAPDALARELCAYARNAALRHAHGVAGRRRVEAEFSLDGMVARYAEMYRNELAASAPSRLSA